MAGWGEPSTSQLPPSGPWGSCLLPRGEGLRGWPEKGFFPRLGVRSRLPGLGPLDPFVAGHCYFCTSPGPWIQLFPRRVPGAAIQLGWCWGKGLGFPFQTPFPDFLSSPPFRFLSQDSLKWPLPPGWVKFGWDRKERWSGITSFWLPLISLGLVTFPRWLPPNPLITQELPGFSYSSTHI